ncbi:MAG: phage BR0599 family protein [Opitutaceae bacterium]|nr:phage BR0599 family protein [Opitutaceae bacterium]
MDQAIVWDRAPDDHRFRRSHNFGLGITYADTATPGDQLVVRTLGALNPTPASYPQLGWRLVPGCDKSYVRCKALGNGDNFRGCPHFPKSNPALIPIKQETAAGGKK